MPPGLPLRELQLDAAVAAVGFVAVAQLQRLELAEAGGHKPLRRHALADEILHDRDGAGRREVPVRLELAVPRAGACRYARRRAAPTGCRGGICLSRSRRAAASLSSSAGPAGLSAGLAGIEEHLRLEDEAVADDADVGPVAEHLPQAAEEVGAEARQLLHLLRERHVEARAEVGDAGLGFAVALLRGGERLLERRELAAQGGDLLVQDLDLRQRPRGDLLLGVERLVERGDLAARRGGAGAARARPAPARRSFSASLAFSVSPSRCEIVLQRLAVDLLQRQQVRQFARSGG